MFDYLRACITSITFNGLSQNVTADYYKVDLTSLGSDFPQSVHLEQKTFVLPPAATRQDIATAVNAELDNINAQQHLDILYGNYIPAQ